MPASFKTSGIYKRPPDAVSYIRGGEVRGTVAFYEGWRGVRMVCRITGLKEGNASIGIGKNEVALSVDQSGVLKTELFKNGISLSKLKGCRLSVGNNELTVISGTVR